MGLIRDAVGTLIDAFRASHTKHEATTRSQPILEQLTREPRFLTAILERYVTRAGSFDRKNYPVVGMGLALNPHFSLVANCWIPLPGRETHVSTKSIHHHGDLLLCTATMFGTGYEHWMFSMPQAQDVSRNVWSMDLLDTSLHGRHHVAFVDHHIAHCPLYPPDLTITLALWTSRHPVSWQDHVKRLPFFQGREAQLRKVAQALGLRRQLDLKIVENFDFFPKDDGFAAMKERQEFQLGPNEDHVHSVFHVIQQTGNDRLASLIRKQIDDGKVRNGRRTVEKLLTDLAQGKPIEGKLSHGHYDVPHANFTRDDIQRALAAALPTGNSNGRKLAAAAHGEAPARARP